MPKGLLLGKKHGIITRCAQKGKEKKRRKTNDHCTHYLGVDTPMTDVVLHVMDWMNDTGRIDEDQIAMVKYYEDKMGVKTGSES